MRPTAAVSLLFLAASASAEERYQELLDDALRLEREIRPGEQADQPLERAFQRLAQAVEVDPRRWEAFALRGTNRCTMAVFCRARLGELLMQARARGEAPETLEGMERAGLHFIQSSVESARQNFQVMHRRMKELREVDPDRLRFAVAAVRYAEASYLRTPEGSPGAIEEFKDLVQRGWNVDFCAEFIARCYIQLGIAAVGDADYPQAQTHWDTAQEWSRSAATSRIILSNKAAAYDLEDEYGRAEAIVREQIAMEPAHPVHWKNLGLMLGHQNRLRGALRAYERTRQICAQIAGPIPHGFFHGNAWLKAAMIHGKLLEQDGDLLLAWRLFLEYRELLGDDYGFCINFGEFAFHMRQYEIAWAFLQRARDLQPFCTIAHQLLLMTAQRKEGTDLERAARVEEARLAQRQALERYLPSEASSELKRICGGLRDRASTSVADGPTPRLAPDPLAEFGANTPPEWLTKAAAERQPFDPALEDATEVAVQEGSGERPPPSPEPPPRRPFGRIAAGALALALALVLVVFRLRQRRQGPGSPRA